VAPRRRQLNHFIRWCEQITAGMTTDDALDYVRAILPRTLVGDHAYGHWESHRRPWFSRFSFPRTQTAQSFIDSTTFRLRRALSIDPELHARINRSIKDRKPLDQPRRLLAGMHDVEAFVRTIVFPAHRGKDDPYATERSTTLELIEQTERTKGGREAAFQFHGQPTTTRSASHRARRAHRPGGHREGLFRMKKTGVLVATFSNQLVD
jgi:hypothetical protein